MLKYQVFHACFEQHLSCYDTFSSHAFRVSLKTGSRDPHFGYLRLPETMICNIRTFVGTTNYRPQRSCGQGNIFAPVCHYVHRGEGVVSHKVLRQRQNPLPRQGTPPQSRPPPGPDTHPPEPDTTPPTRHSPPPPPGKQTPAYGLRAAGTHPTGMHSCFANGYEESVDA